MTWFRNNFMYVSIFTFFSLPVSNLRSVSVKSRQTCSPASHTARTFCSGCSPTSELHLSGSWFRRPNDSRLKKWYTMTLIPRYICLILIIVCRTSSLGPRAQLRQTRRGWRKSIAKSVSAVSSIKTELKATFLKMSKRSTTSRLSEVTLNGF
jgi:hypothetical protein